MAEEGLRSFASLISPSRWRVQGLLLLVPEGHQTAEATSSNESFHATFSLEIELGEL